MARKKEEVPRNEHGQGFHDRPAGEKSRYDPEYEMPDPEAVEEDIQEVEKAYKPRKKKSA
ncbi:MAG TPA: hypothetical protein VK473_15310 [Terriglobales bacterium]|nr:hypothetical protein [Terriglobales bacterium]